MKRLAASVAIVGTFTGLFPAITSKPAPASGESLTCSTSADCAWICQVAWNRIDDQDGFLRGKRHLLMDRDGKYCDMFRAVLRHAGVKPLRLPPRSPDLNAFAERFVRTIKEECLDRIIFFGENMLRHAVKEFAAHYHRERNH